MSRIGYSCEGCTKNCNDGNEGFDKKVANCSFCKHVDVNQMDAPCEQCLINAVCNFEEKERVINE